MDDFADRQADGETGAALLLDDLRSGAFGRIEDLLRRVGVEAGPLVERQAADGGARPDRRHAVAMFAEDEGIDLRRRRLQFLGEVAAETRGIEDRSQADHALP